MAGPLIVILGPTASGKSGLAMEIARRFNGELICADSRTVYKGMDIGTAKPAIHERKEVTHHLLDIVEPDESFSAAKFKELALQAIELIEAKGKLPIVVGGTGLYIDSLIFDFAFSPTVANESREDLEELRIGELQQRLRDENIDLPLNHKNKRHLIRAIETNGQVPVRKNIKTNTLVIGLDIPKPELVKRIAKRTKSMINDGLETEVGELVEKFGSDAPGLSAVGYREWHESKNKKDVEHKINNSTIQYAKRQRTWFRRNEHIKWVNNTDEAIKLVQEFLQQKQ